MYSCCHVSVSNCTRNANYESVQKFGIPLEHTAEECPGSNRKICIFGSPFLPLTSFLTSVIIACCCSQNNQMSANRNHDCRSPCHIVYCEVPPSLPFCSVRRRREIPLAAIVITALFSFTISEKCCQNCQNGKSSRVIVVFICDSDRSTCSASSDSRVASSA